MSSLQKFHRRTNGGAPEVKLIGSAAPFAGSGFYLGMAGDGTSYMYVAPKSTEILKTFGSYKTARGTTSSTDGLANTNTLYALGSAAHPAAYYCKTLTSGGYNTWYLPTTNELVTCWTNHAATPFATADAFIGRYHWSSTENGASFAYGVQMNTLSSGAGIPAVRHKGTTVGPYGNAGCYYVRAVRRGL